MDWDDVKLLVCPQLSLAQILTYTRVSASNAARLYNTTMSMASVLPEDWQFQCQLNGNHVWDGFIIRSLLEDRRQHGTVLDVPHTGNQADRFTAVMQERNERIILQGQPDAISHFCNKCMRVYKNEDGTYSKCIYLQFHGST